MLSEIESSMDVIEGHARDSCEAYANVTTINRADIGGGAPASAERRFTPPMLFGSAPSVMPTVVEISDGVFLASEDLSANSHVARPIPTIAEDGVITQPAGNSKRISPAGGRDNTPIDANDSVHAANTTLRINPADAVRPVPRADSGEVELYIENNSDMVQQHQAKADCDVNNDMYISAESAHAALNSDLTPDYVELADMDAEARRTLLNRTMMNRTMFTPPNEPCRVVRKPSEESSKLRFPFPSSEVTSDHECLSEVTEKLPVLRPVNARVHHSSDHSKRGQASQSDVIMLDPSMAGRAERVKTQQRPGMQQPSPGTPATHLSNPRFNPSSMSPTSPSNLR